MDFILIERNGAKATVRLNRGKANTLNHQMVQELTAAFKELESDEAVKAVILTGHGEFFSAGLDVLELYDYNEEKMYQFWKDFSIAFETVARFPKLLVCAINGHSPAGGCVFAVGADFRVMAEGKYRIGLNEIPVGIVIPPAIFRMYNFWIGERTAYQYLLQGKLYTAEEGSKIGLIDVVCPLEEVEAKANEIIDNLLKFDTTVWQMSKAIMREDMLTVFDKDFDLTFTPIIKQWWSPGARAAMGALVASLKK
ncbi:MAG: enoyl-CoA hydratase/isomerase family protein [Sphingobacteriales bacterium JAD_PAG50586_3]|nr:MAG: enoyl-CoA hydratase/isomerase family protein [Sphingobacteriales bacterium JAD_PAG50586_3]